MAIAFKIIVSLVAVLHIYFLVLEMFLWTKPFGLKTFKLDKEFAERSAALAMNQGLYNGFLAAGLIWSLFASEMLQKPLAVFFLSCVIVAGVFGGATVNKRIFIIQSIPAIAALVLCFAIG